MVLGIERQKFDPITARRTNPNECHPDSALEGRNGPTNKLSQEEMAHANVNTATVFGAKPTIAAFQKERRQRSVADAALLSRAIPVPATGIKHNAEDYLRRQHIALDLPTPPRD